MEENPHSPPGPYVLFDNLDKKNRLCMNVWNIYDPEQEAEGLYMKYLYIYCRGSEICINLWNMDFIEITENLNTEIEWDSTNTIYSFENALKSRQLTVNNIEGTYFDFLDAIQKNKNLRDMIFSSGDVKHLASNQSDDGIFTYHHQLVVDENRPDSDIKWDVSENVKVRFRIRFSVDLTNKKLLNIQFDKGSRGMPLIEPINWYPTRSMDGILISQEKAHSIDFFTYVSDLK